MRENQQRIVLVTGGGSGIGKSITKAFIDAGDRVVVIQRSEVSIDGGEWLECDLADCDSIQPLVESIAEKHGRIDVLVNNAGVMFEDSVAETTAEQWQRALDVNLTAPFLLIKHSLPHLINSGGAIVNISSIEGQASNPKHAAYCASKSGLDGLTRAVAVDAGPHGVRCNAIAPGWIDTQFNEAFIEQQPNTDRFRQGLSQIHPILKTGKPSDIAELAVWLASKKASFVTGQVWTVDGGRMTKLSLPN